MARLSLMIPCIVFTLVWVRDGRLSAPASLLTGVALLTGGMLSAFTHLSTLRLKITEWDGTDGDNKFEVERGMLDETAAHLLTGSLLCAFDAAALVIGMNVSSTKNGQLYGFWAAFTSGLSSYILVIFIFVIPRLYSAYVEINNVTPGLNGFNRSRRGGR
ncbi:hypothetical protein [Streptomyces sp. NBC_00059]|uniref:hypothetical protein n=1 Tax=Streptomyces sp. NBC_00059 TaxID=2975635 RepID=UPI00225C054B|nr:hypothetical protein [Streptomyces sp. NBC_00059]MCX5410754.1 hypothetical protein [Streptomyces sp. NBC_00059]